MISTSLFILYLENMVICCHWTFQRAKSLPQQQIRTFWNIYHKPDMIYLVLKKKSLNG